MASVNWRLPIWIEHQVQRIITQQEINGWYFNTELAEQRIRELDNKQQEIYEEVRPMLKPEVIHKWTEVNKPFTRTGDFISRVRNWFGSDMVDSVGGPHSFVEFVEPDLGSRARLMRQLEQHGWKPTEFTEKGNPRLTEDSLECLGGIGGDIAKWYIYNHRKSQIEGWLRHVRPDHRITAIANTCGTPTGRMRHSVVVNVPKAAEDVLFGKEMRELFTVPDGKVLIGHDAAGIEARMMAHYLNDAELIQIIVDPDGDFHTLVWDSIRDFIDSRTNAKNVEYAYIYGAGDAKLGRMADRRPKGWSEVRTGKAIREALAKGIPALAALRAAVEQQASRGYLVGLDGRKVPVRSSHSALNTLFQSGAAIVMKRSMIYLDEWQRREGIDALKVGDFHDEGQNEVENISEKIELFCDLAVKSIRQAGEFFKLRCPLDAEAKVGMNWAETH